MGETLRLATTMRQIAANVGLYSQTAFVGHGIKGMNASMVMQHSRKQKLRRKAAGGNMKKTIATIKEALAMPYGEYQSGSYLRSSEDMIFDQETWSDEDDARDVDFETYPFWIITDDGEDPHGICDEKDFREFQEGL